MIPELTAFADREFARRRSRARLTRAGAAFGLVAAAALELFVARRGTSPSLDAETQGNARLGPRAIEIDAEPPPNDLVIAPPIDVPELTVVPRPFRDEAAQR